jgi:hypothetical protein
LEDRRGRRGGEREREGEEDGGGETRERDRYTDYTEIGGVDFLRCSVCKSASYCGKECQKNDWKAHKKVCAHIPNE